MAQAGVNERWLGTLMSQILRVAEESEKHGNTWHLPRRVRWRELRALPKKARSLAEYIERIEKRRPELHALPDPWQYPARLFPDLPKSLRDYARCLDSAIEDLAHLRRHSGQGTMLDAYLRPALTHLLAGTEFASGRPHYSELSTLLLRVVPGETRFITDNLERFARQHKKKVEAEREKLNRLCSVGIVPLPLYRQAGKIPNPEETT